MEFWKKSWVYAGAVVALSMFAIVGCAGGSSSKVEEKTADIEISADSLEHLADAVWEFSKSHPDGFTLELSTLTEPSEGIAVSYASTQSSILRNQLDSVITHALNHDGYVGGWLDVKDSLYYFDSTRLFPEDSLDAAIAFGKENGQKAIFVISKGEEIRLEE